MKKIISILMSVLMLAGCFVSLIPSVVASGETIQNGNIVPVVTKDELIYSENFEKAGLGGTTDAPVADAALLKALGWSGTLGAQKDESGAIQKHPTYGYEYRDTVSLVTEGEDHAVEIKAYASGYLDLTFVDDKRLAGGDYIVEYTYRFTDNLGGAFQNFGVKSGGDASKTDSKDTVVTALVQESGQTDMKAGFPGQVYTQMKANSHPFEFHDIATEKVVYISKDQYNPYNQRDKTVTRQANVGSTYGREIRFRFVVDNQFGISMWTIAENGTATLIAYTDMAEFLNAPQNWSSACKGIRSDIALSCQRSLTIEVDDIEVYTIKRDTPKDTGWEALAPGLILSEFVTRASEGTADVVTIDADGNVLMDTDGNYKYAPDGKTESFRHEWIEIYNAGKTAVNVYDYAIARAAGIKADNLYSSTVGEADVCYILPGENTVTGVNQYQGEDITRTYTNPAYENGVLQPGDAAILFIPNNWFYSEGPTYSSVNTFKELDLKGVYGMTDAEIAKLKIFTICSKYNFGNNNSGCDLFAVTPVETVTEGDTTTKVAKVLGHNITDHDYIVSLSADFKDGSSTYSVFDGYGCNGYSVEQHKSNEVMFYDAKSNTFRGHGVVDADLRPAKKTLDNPCTPGYLPPSHNIALHYVVLTGMLLENDSVERVYYNAEFVPSIVPEDTLTKKFIGWRDEAGNFLQTLAPVRERGKNIVLTAVYESEIPNLLGYQRTAAENGRYDIRIVASVDRLDSVAFGMKIHFKYDNGQGKVSGSREYYCRYVYEEISQDYGSGTISADAYNSNYLVVFHIEDCPVGIITEYSVTTFAIFEDPETGARNTEWNTDVLNFTMRV